MLYTVRDVRKGLKKNPDTLSQENWVGQVRVKRVTLASRLAKKQSVA